MSIKTSSLLNAPELSEARRISVHHRIMPDFAVFFFVANANANARCRFEPSSFQSTQFSLS
jgi:hypothetical protein